MRALGIVTLLVLLALTACGTLEVGVERTPSAGTTAAAQTQTASQAQFNAQVAASATALHLTAQTSSRSATPPATPTPPATATPPPSAPSQTPTPKPAPPSKTPIIACTPPPCKTGETYFCPGQCPGGCGAICATPVSPNTCATSLCFTASPSPAERNDTVTLSWNAPGATEVVIWWISKLGERVERAKLPPTGTLTAALSDISVSGTAVRLTAEAYDAPHDKWTGLIALELPLKNNLSIRSFTVSPTEVAPGSMVTLNWEATGDEADIGVVSRIGQLPGMLTPVPVSGSLSLNIDARYRNLAIFFLNVRSGDLYTSTSLSVKLTCPDIWFFPNPPGECPGATQSTQMAVQHFEHGLMIWTAVDDYIRILYEAVPSSGRYVEYKPNIWQAGMPESDPAITPPAGYFQPVRGFGKIWREANTGSGQSIRDRLGWALEPEFAIAGARQCNTASKYQTCYIGDPLGVVYALKPENSGWYVWTGPTPAP